MLGDVFEPDINPTVDAEPAHDTLADAGPESCALPEPPGQIIVNLGDEGLQPGDTIDPYLTAHVASGVQVRIPAGTYDWNGTFPPDLNEGSIIGEGEVVWDAGDRWGFSGNFTASGDAEIRNITVRGRCDSDGKFRAIVTEPGATLTLRNFWMPDGCYPELERSGFYIPSSHVGTLRFVDSRIEGFPNNGLYASSASGPVHVIGGLYRNNNIANVRLGSSGSSAREVVIVNDEVAPANEFGNTNQRGLRIRAPGEQILIEDLSITQLVTGQPIQIHREAPGSGTLLRVRIRNDEPSSAIGIYAGEWSGEEIDLTGTGNLEITAGTFGEVCRGEGCAPPRTEPRPFCR